MQSLLVYLDSSDYSALSDPKRETPETAALTQQLRRWVADKQIICCYSGTHLSEMAPLEPTYADAAERRADIMVELCGRNTLISQDRLIRWEVNDLLGSTDSPPQVLSSTGTWYPDGVPDVMSEIKFSLSDSVEETIAESSLNRAGRREAKRKLLSGTKVRAGFKTVLTRGARTDSLDAIVQRYPMRDQDARVLSRWIVGDATLGEATEAFAESLRDPRWMMRWFREHHDLLSPFVDRARAPMRPVIDGLMKMASIGATLAELDKASGTDQYTAVLGRTRWLAHQDEMLKTIALKFAGNIASADVGKLTAHALDDQCPSLSVGVRTLHSTWFTALARNSPRKPALSDFSDGLHAMYAPHVQVFRADAFMAPIVSKHARRFPVQVVSKLSHLRSTIESLLS